MEKSHKGLYKSHSVSYTKKRVTRMLSMLNHVKPANLAENALRFNTERDSVTATWTGEAAMVLKASNVPPRPEPRRERQSA